MNQQALNTAVKQYRAADQKELAKLSALLKTTKAEAFQPVKGSKPSRT